MRTVSANEIANSVYAALPAPIKRCLRVVVTPDLKRRLRTAANKMGVFGPNQPLLSVVVPVYNVSDHLAECLDSISKQSYRNLEIIVIDDGSTDESLKIARNISKSDRRMKVHTQPNAGLGAARNVGAGIARGSYLVFADSDDVVPLKAYETMVKSLQLSGSDLVTGTFYRFNSTTHQVPRWAKRVHADRRLGITISDYLDGLVNVYAWNKMFRKTFWDSLGMTYTEGVRYEDQEPTTRMFLLASKIDVIPESVYGYRLREDESSITQTKHLIRDVQDRLHVIKLTANTINESGTNAVREAWVSKLIRFDVLPYIREGFDADSEYRSVVVELCKFVYEATDENIIQHSPVKNRALIALVLSGNWDIVGRALLFSDETGAHLPTTWSGHEAKYDAPFGSEIRYDFRHFGLTLALEETKAVAVTRYVSVDSRGRIHIDGWAFIKNLGLQGSPDGTRIQVFARNSDLDISLPMSTEPARFPGATRWAGSKWADYEASGFSAAIDSHELAQHMSVQNAAQSIGSWRFHVHIETAGVVRSTALDRRVSGSTASFLDSGAVVDGIDWQWSFDEANGLTLLGNSEVVLVQSSVHEDLLNLVLSGKSAVTVKSGRLVRGKKKIVGKLNKGPTGISLVFELSGLDFEKPSSWTLKFSGLGQIANKMTLPLGTSKHLLTEDLAIRRAETGTLHLDVLPQQLELHSMEVLDGAVKLSGRSIAPTLDSDGMSLNLVSSSSKSMFQPLIWDQSSFCVVVPLKGLTGESLPFDGYSLRVSDRYGRERTIVFSTQIRREIPLEIVAPSHRIKLTTTKYGNAWVRLSAPLEDSEVGQYNQKQLQAEYLASGLVIDQNCVLFHAYLGAQATDSSLAISKYLLEHRPELRVIWATVSETVEIPAGSERVILNSRAWYKALGSAGYIVHNIYFDPWFELKPGQKYIQTWHGTPLKTINRSYWQGIGRQQAWIDRMEQQAKSWTYLISPSAYYSEVVAKESNFQGRILELGYPRNDDLAPSSSAKSRRAEFRSRHGISADERVILYAPTWREGLSAKSWQAEMVQFLDSRSLMNDLGPGFTLLIRGHGHNARTAASQELEGNVIDVTHYPNINDLYLAADVIVTDYSSVMFDAVVVDKPLIFFVPDLEEYNASPRGVYLNIGEVAPGPLVFAQHELVDSLINMDDGQMTSSDKYVDFKKKFSPFSDGLSTKRVVEDIWG